MPPSDHTNMSRVIVLQQTPQSGRLYVPFRSVGWEPCQSRRLRIGNCVFVLFQLGLNVGNEKGKCKMTTTKTSMTNHIARKMFEKCRQSHPHNASPMDIYRTSHHSVIPIRQTPLLAACCAVLLSPEWTLYSLYDWGNPHHSVCKNTDCGTG